MRDRAISGRASVSARPIGEVVAPLVERVSPFDAIPEAPLVERPMFYIEPKDQNPASERERQRTLIALVRKLGPEVMLWHTPNGSRRSQWEKLALDRDGMLAGFPDLTFLWRSPYDKPIHAYIEMKSGSGDLTQGQIVTCNALYRRDAPVAVFRRPETALGWLRELGAPIVPASDPERIRGLPPRWPANGVT